MASLSNLVLTGGNNASGAGLQLTANASATLTNVNVIGNTATFGGGGIYVDSGATLTMTGGGVSNNSAGDALGGGGIYLLGSATLTDVALVGNTTPGEGGAINVIGELGGTLTLLRGPSPATQRRTAAAS